MLHLYTQRLLIIKFLKAIDHRRSACWSKNQGVTIGFVSTANVWWRRVIVIGGQFLAGTRGTAALAGRIQALPSVAGYDARQNIFVREVFLNLTENNLAILIVDSLSSFDSRTWGAPCQVIQITHAGQWALGHMFQRQMAKRGRLFFNGSSCINKRTR